MQSIKVKIPVIDLIKSIITKIRFTAKVF